MKLISFESTRGAATGVLLEDGGIVSTADIDPVLPTGMRALLGLGIDRLRRLLDRAASLQPSVRIEEVNLLPVVPDPHAIWGIALNYRSHIAEGNHPTPSHPATFLRLPLSHVGHRQPLIKPKSSNQYDYEGELAVIIGEPAHKVSRAQAMRHVLGYACANEGSVREWQKHTSQITPGKNFLGSGSLGPWLTLAADVPDIADRLLTTTLNGVVVQQERVGETLFDIPALIEYLSGVVPLLTGDVILTGTPGGVGFRRNPQLFLNSGDVCTVTIDGLGTLENFILEEGSSWQGGAVEEVTHRRLAAGIR